jgi:glycosyltransferase involved in cell wall biosynthesis
MKIAMFSTYDISGGASRACVRLKHGLLLDKRADIRYFVKFKKEESKKTIVLKSKEVLKDDLEGLINLYFRENRTNLSDTLFSFSFSDIILPDLKPFDIINLHWIETFISLENLYELVKLNKPIVWTLHDMKAFTGGCHYSSNCEKYINECNNCPQLTNDPKELVTKVFQEKKEIFKNANITIVTPSIWLANEAKKSKIFKNKKIEVIPYGLDTSIFFPRNPRKAKKMFGIDEETIVLSFGVIDHSEKRKGFKELLEAISLIENKIKNKKITALLFGTSTDTNLPFKVIHIGHVNDDEKLSYLYSASDIFILPSLEDNLPNTILEALACGTPIIAFDTGGAKDIINDSNGKIVPKGDIKKLSEEIYNLICDKELREKKGKTGAKLIQNNYSLKHQANAYLKLFHEIKEKDFNYLKNNNLIFNFDKQIRSYFFRDYSTIEDKNYLFSSNYNNFYNSINNLKEQYIIYGYGTIGKTIEKIIPNQVIIFIDRKAELIRKENVKHPSEIKSLEYDKILISVLGREKEIIEYLNKELEIKEDKIISIKI